MRNWQVGRFSNMQRRTFSSTFFFYFQVTVATRQGNTTSNSSVPYRTAPAPPLAGPAVNGTALNHTTILITWFPPEIKKLRGAVVTYLVELEETSLPGAPVSRVGQFPGNQTRLEVTDLRANTFYTFYVRMSLVCYILIWRALNKFN